MANKTVELVNLWAAFEETYPAASIDDFCRYRLANQQQDLRVKPQAGPAVPSQSAGVLMRLIGRINKMNMVYANAALAGTGLMQLEEFGLLVHIQQEKNPRKTDIIHSNLMELSSGTDMLNRLKNRGFIHEYEDLEDRRSKRLELTAQGVAVVGRCRQQVGKLAVMMLHNVPDDDILLCINLLKKTEQEFSALLPVHKGRPFDEIFEEIMNSSGA